MYKYLQETYLRLVKVFQVVLKSQPPKNRSEPG